MPKDHRVTAGRYGTKGGQLTRDDFASIVFTLLPVEEQPPGSARETARMSTRLLPAETAAAADGLLAALGKAWPDEPIATLAESVATLLGRLAELSPDDAANVLYAAALLCGEEAERSGTDRDVATRLKQAAVATATPATAAAGVGVATELAFDD